jgi:hypothetical protein
VCISRYSASESLCLLTTFPHILCYRLCACAKSIWGVRLIGVTNKTSYLGRPWALPNDSKHNEAGFSMISTGWLRLQVAQTPRSRGLVIFVLTRDNRQTDTQTDCFTPAAHACMHARTRDKNCPKIIIMI